MKRRHLSDEQIQEFALSDATTQHPHIEACTDCNKKLKQYKLLFLELPKIESHKLDDLTRINILHAIEKKNTTSNSRAASDRGALVFSSISMASILLAIHYGLENLNTILASKVSHLVIIIAFIFLFLEAHNTLKSYRNSIRQLKYLDSTITF